ncbi:hypothetical protein T440DRAFT_473560 [Plenodomus tracheiphilus IPT5]|uniref:HTH CENPB-type domain-containing protein n=1 Tax=Plenodomus tracheiphilus IPT5 TaxID=1408161 RepID=A0A6A7APL8_9PLEO|nr:hypothetical protein T440DRAFT_473560 [Plenodomus tracheiphilus IPT5]
MSSIKAALAAIDAQKPREKVNYKKIAEQYSCSRVTLARRHQDEQELLRYIEHLTRQGLLPTRSMIQNFASQIAKKELRKHWVDRYIQRYQVNLILSWTTGINRTRYQANSALKYNLYFKLLAYKIKEYKVKPCHTYNMDEKGFLLGVVTRSKRVFSKRLYQEGRLRSIL